MKKIIALLLSVIMVLGLVACGDNAGDNEGGNGNEGGQSAGADLDWTQGADASDGEVTLRVATWRQYDQPYYEEIIKRFEEKYDWINVTLEINPSQSAYYSNIQADIMSGTAPDVFDLHSGYVVSYAEEGALAPQTNFDYMDSYSDKAKYLTMINEENYAYMVAYNYFGFIYNTDIFAKEGLSVPTTPDEMVDVVNKLKKAGYGGVAYSGATNGAKIGHCILAGAMNTEGLFDLYQGIDNGSITDISTVEGTEEAFKSLQTYVDNDIWYNAYEGISYEAAISLFAQEKSAILYGGTYTIGEAQYTYPNINVGYFAIPTYVDNGVSYAEAAQNAVISATCKNLGAAKLWVEFLATPEISSYFCENSKMLPTIEGVTLNNEVSQMIQNSATDFAFAPNELDNQEYWYAAFDAVMDNVMFKGAKWMDEVKKLTRKLEDYDLSSL